MIMELWPSARNLPCHTEADVGKTDTAVNEENGKTRQRKEPVEDLVTVVGQVDECEAAEEKLHNDYVDGATLLVNLGEELGGHACITVRIILRATVASETYRWQQEPGLCG